MGSIIKLKRMRRESLTADILIHLIIAALSLLTLYPFVYIVSCAFSDPLNVVAQRVWLLPKGFSLKAFERVFAAPSIWRSFGNSLFFTVACTLLCVLNSMLAGYALAFPRLVFRRIFVVALIIPMFFTGGLIPSFIIMTKLGLYNNLLSIILPSALSIWNIILARTFIHRLPASLQEAALIDGAGDWKIFLHVILPLSKPILAVLSLYTALAVWNNWFSFLVYLPQRADWHPLSMLLVKVLLWGNMSAVMKSGDLVDASQIKNAMEQAAVGAQMKYAVIVMATVPVMLVYPFVQKYFVQGALLGSLKE